MTTTLTVRLPTALARQLKERARAEKTSPSAVLRQAAITYVRTPTKGKALNALQRHVDAYAGTWDGYCSGEDLLRKTRP